MEEYNLHKKEDDLLEALRDEALKRICTEFEETNRPVVVGNRGRSVKIFEALARENSISISNNGNHLEILPTAEGLEKARQMKHSC